MISLIDIPADKDPLSKGAHFSRFCMTCVVMQAAGLLVLAVACGKLAHRAGAIPPVVGFTSEHRAITGAIKPVGMTDARFDRLVRDVGESALTWTEKGLTPELAAYVTPACWAKLSEIAKRVRPQNAKEYLQELQIDEKDGLRVVNGSAIDARAMLRGTLITRSAEGEVRNRYYWGVQFAQFAPNEDNALGWRMTDFFEISETDYFRADITRAASESVRTTPRSQ